MARMLLKMGMMAAFAAMATCTSAQVTPICVPEDMFGCLTNSDCCDTQNECYYNYCVPAQTVATEENATAVPVPPTCVTDGNFGCIYNGDCCTSTYVCLGGYCRAPSLDDEVSSLKAKLDSFSQ